MPTPSVATTVTPYDLRAAVERAHLWLISSVLRHLETDGPLDLRATTDLADFVARVMPAVRMYERLAARLVAAP